MKLDEIIKKRLKACYHYVVILFALLAVYCPANSQEKEENKEPPAGGTSVKLSQEVMNPTTLAWQLQLEEYAIFKTENQDGFAQNFRFRGIIPMKEGFLIKVPQFGGSSAQDGIYRFQPEQMISLALHNGVLALLLPLLLQILENGRCTGSWKISFQYRIMVNTVHLLTLFCSLMFFILGQMVFMQE